MGFLDRLLGREPRQQQPYRQPYGARPADARPPADPDQAAIERYRYLLRTAPPRAIEQAHAEAFAQLTPEQRRQVLDGLAAEVPPAERATDDDPRSLARMATRAELRQPGTLERSFGRAGGVGGGLGGGMGMGGMIAGSLLASVAGAFVGTAIADSLFDLSDQGDAAADAGGDPGSDAGADGYGDGGDVSADGGGWGGDGGGWGDVGGGDFGGGDFGGGDF
ncbi:hypothetical protein [Cellulomonas sp. PS-H5]|uniref:hypothetical protein n=1 Tax=Cellulomonas sp. PS-H5 TaxID=2820400 RepID=UPI001C4ECBD9|nr:hypothetical protein [Cellulomonas sp. PS-H5]MBW0252989.1 hypothetical protein [Cellulomonas sp. PS-H5]